MEILTNVSYGYVHDEESMKITKKFDTFEDLERYLFVGEGGCNTGLPNYKKMVFLCAKIQQIDTKSLFKRLVFDFVKYQCDGGAVPIADTNAMDIVDMIDSMRDRHSKTFVEFFSLFKTTKRITISPFNVLDHFTIYRKLKGRKQNSQKKVKSSAYVTNSNINFLMKKTKTLFEKTTASYVPNIHVEDLDRFREGSDKIEKLRRGIFLFNNLINTQHVGANTYLDIGYSKLLKKKKIYKITARLILMCNIENQFGGIPNSILYSQPDCVVWFETDGAPLSG